MSRDSVWDDLIARLESDICARSKSTVASDTDERAWEEARSLIRSYAHVLGALRIGIRPEDVEDIVQDVLLKLHSLDSLRRLRLAGSPSGYIVVMVRNAAYDLVRAQVRESTFLRQLAREPSASSSEEATSPADGVTLRLQQEMQLLTQEERALLRMRFWRSMTIKDISKETGDAYSAVAVKMFRLLKRLRDRLERPDTP
jgi:RNA polymerase sigma factor (sigma-70 family)